MILYNKCRIIQKINKTNHFHGGKITVQTLSDKDGVGREDFLQIILNIFKTCCHTLKHLWRDSRIPATTYKFS